MNPGPLQPPPRSPPISGSLGFLIFFLLFIVIPAIMIGFLAELYLSWERDQADRQALQYSRRALGRISSFFDIDFQLQKKFRWLTAQWVRGRISSDQWPRILEKAQRKWGIRFDVYHFNGKGDLVTPASMQIRARPLFQKLRAFLCHFDNNPISTQVKTVKSLLGEGWHDLPLFRGKIRRFKGLGREGLFFWDVDPFSVEGAVIFVLWDVPGALAFARHRLRTLNPRTPLNAFIREQAGSFQTLSPDLATHVPPLVSRQLERGSQPMTQVEGKTWVSRKYRDFTLFLGTPPVSSDLERIGRHSPHLLAAMVLIGFFLSYRWIIQGRDPYLSLRLKLLIFFLYVLAIPFTGVLALASKTLRETERVLLENANQAGMEAIKVIDDGFLNEPRKFQKRFDGFHERLKNPIAHHFFDREMNRTFWARDFSTMEIRDGAGKILHSLGGWISTDGAVREVFDRAALDAIKRFVPERYIPSRSEAKTGAGAITDAMSQSGDLGLSNLFEYPGALRRIVLPHGDFFLYGNAFHDPKLPAVVMAISLPTVHVKEEYVKRTLLTLQNPSSNRLRIFAVDENDLGWTPIEGGRSDQLRAFAQQVKMTGEPLSERLSWHGTSWIAVGYPGKQIPEYRFLALFPADRIARPLENLRRQILLGIALALFLTLLLGWVLAGTLLEPISQLSRGIFALQDKNVRFRLDRFPKDELGDLSRAFNEMMEHLEEFSSGKLVQEQLLPGKPLSCGEYKVFGLSKPASNLGGDYFDYLLIDENRFLVLMGDVAGHGIPAALIMAMSKAIVTTFPQPGARPRELLETLNRALFLVMGGKLLMSMGLLFVDTGTHEMIYFHAGHTFPLVWSLSSIVEYDRGRGFPIGRPSAAGIHHTELSLPKGSRLVLYSDGLIESLGTEGTTDSYARFRDFVWNLGWPPLEETCHSLIEKHEFFRTGKAQPDDFTVVVLERA